jgi:hypothetical protein
LGAEKTVERIGRSVRLRDGHPELDWPEDIICRNVIEWEGEALVRHETETIVETGEWKVFSETVPNLEVRIGAILSLERIAQDSTRHDSGRDHVRVMEILCSYIRHNAPARVAENHSFGEWEPLPEDATPEQRADRAKEREERFGRSMLGVQSRHLVDRIKDESIRV